MGIPILTKEGLVGQRWIIDDYFRAGETLYAGDVVGIKQGSATQGYHPRVFKLDGNVAERRVIGIVHTPTSKDVGDQVATTGTAGAEDQFVPIVVKGIAKALSSGSIGVGDPVVPSGSTGSPTGKTTSVARVEQSPSPSEGDSIVGRCLTITSGENEEVEILVDLAGTSS